MQTPPHSFHCFLFPFKWEHLFYDDKPLNVRINLDEFERKLGIGTESVGALPKRWLRKPFNIDTELAYNEYNYFYDFVRDVVYDRGDSNLQNAKLEGDSLVRHYEYLLPFHNTHTPAGASYFQIECNVGNWQAYQEKTYWLRIKKIFLDVYETGVGILAFHLLNESYGKPEDVLNINQYGRRAFVGGFQLTGYPSKTGKEADHEKFVDLAKSISIQLGDGKIIKEDFKASEFSDTYKKIPYILPIFITELLAGAAYSNIVTTDWYIEKKRENYIWISPSIDDRMFVASWYCCDIASHKKQLKGILNTEYQVDWKSFVEKSDFWYKYIFIDKYHGESNNNRRIQTDQAVASTYDRWMNYGTLYGISRYSFVMFCVEDINTPDYTLAVFETMYLKMVELSLVQRASVLRFSDEVQYISSMTKGEQKTEQIRGLYGYHIRFVNKIDFREVTAQEQGIELYDRMQEAMRVNTQVEYLDKEISQLHNYALLLEERKRGEEAEERQIEEQKRTEKLDRITYFGVPIAVITLMLSVIGFIKDVKLKIDESDSYPIQLTFQVIVVEIILAMLLTFQVNKMIAEQGIKFSLSRKVIYIILLLIGIIITPFLRAFIFNLYLP